MKRILLFAVAALVTIGSFAQTKIGKVNFSELIELTPEADEAYNVLLATQTDVQETLQAMFEEYQTKYQTYEQKVSTWSASVREMKEKELGEMQNRINEFRQNSSNEIQQQQQTLMAPIQQKVMEVVQTIAKAQGLTLVLDESQALYFDDAQVVNINLEARKALGIAEDATIEALYTARQAAMQQ